MANLLPRDSGPLAPVTDPIYHYTTAHGLVGVLSSRRLWASQATSLNDHAEVRQGWHLIVESLQRLLVAHPDDPDLRGLLSWAKNPIDNARHVCVLSASLRGDDANQWRLYAGGGHGYVIELDPRVALAATAVEAALPAVSDVETGALLLDFDVFFVSDWFKVIYDRQELESAVSDLWKALADQEPPRPDPSLSRQEQEAAYDVWRSEVSSVALSELATLAHLYKTEGFSGEHEVRVIVTNLTEGRHLRYRASPNGVVAYQELATPPAGHQPHRPYFLGVPTRLPAQQLPVQSVGLGPLAPVGHDETILDYLRTVDLEQVPVHTSRVPLR